MGFASVILKKQAMSNMFMNMVQLCRGLTIEHNNQADNVLLDYVIPLFSPYK